MQRKWFKLDTAALIFPAARTARWSNSFRVSAEFRDEINPRILQMAVDGLKNRFPTFYVRLSSGLFWYRLEESSKTPRVINDYAYPLVNMTSSELRKNCIRILYFKNRIALEVFHSVSDGNGVFFFFKNLIRQYISLVYGVNCNDSLEFPSLSESPLEGELEDSFYKNSNDFKVSENEKKAFWNYGKKTRNSYRHLITGTCDADKLYEASHFYGCSVTCFVSALMLKALIRIQDEKVVRKKQKQVCVAIPVNLRKLFGSRTLRNFVLTLNTGVDPKLGEYSLQDLCNVISHQLKAKATRQYMGGIIASTVKPQKLIFFRLLPLFIKNILLNIGYAFIGEKGSSINVSNLGIETLPEELEEFVERMDFIIGIQKRYPNNCSIVSFKGKTRINMIRDIEDPTLERYFFTSLVELGIPVYIESNEVKTCIV